MKKKTIDAQLNNFKTQQMYLRQCMSLAENVFDFKNLPIFIDKAYLNKELLRKGSIAFFRDEEMGLLALPYKQIGKSDVYGRPKAIQVIGQNGYQKKLKNTLNKKEFVIMYDNNGRYPLIIDLYQYAHRLALYERTSDINIANQKTNRVWVCNSDNEKTLQDILKQVDSFEESIATYDNIDIEEIQCIMQPAPFVADKIDEKKRNLYNEFLRLIGVANLGVNKKERQIVDEVQAMQGGTIASRFSRFTPRKDALDLINEHLLIDGESKIEVEYYDGLPTTLEEVQNVEVESEGDSNDGLLDISNVSA